MGRCQLDGMELLYVVMEYAEENLSQVLAQRPLTPPEARDMLEPVLDTLAFIHRKGFVHGHVKPTNIMAVNNQLKISSDGLCRIGDRVRFAAAGPPTIRPSLPRERSCRQRRLVARYDLVEVLTQRVPVWARTGEGNRKFPTHFPAPFLDVTRHCLLRDPQRRYTVAGIAAALRQDSAAGATAAPQESFAMRRYIAPASALALLLVAIIVGPRLFKRSPAAPPLSPPWNSLSLRQNRSRLLQRLKLNSPQAEPATKSRLVPVPCRSPRPPMRQPKPVRAPQAKSLTKSCPTYPGKPEKPFKAR